MPGPLIVLFVPGVTPGKWQRVWSDRRRDELRLELREQHDALEAVRAGAAHMALLRDVERDDDLHAIPLYRERPVVVAPKDSVISAFDELSLADLADENLLEGEDAGTVELVAANVGVAIMPQSVARLHARKDVLARPLSDGRETGISLVWRVDQQHPDVDAFIGIVRGRTANSSR